MKMTRGRHAKPQPLIRFLTLFLALGSFLLPRSAGAQEEVRLQGREVAVYNLAGQVEIVAGGGSDVVVQVMRGGGDGDELSLQTIQADGREALVVQYPGDRIVYSELGRNSKTEVRVRSDGTFGDGGRSRGDGVEIRGSGRGLEAWADLRITVPSGKDLAVYLAVGEAEASGLEADLLIDTGSGAIQAFGITGEVNLDTGSGEIVAEEIQGNLLVDTGSGSVRVTGVEGDEVMVDTGSGSVVAGGITSSRLEVDTGSGGIRLTRVSSPEVYLDTGSGRIEVELLQDVDRMVIDTGSGSVTIQMPAGLGAEVEIDTGSGGIDLDVPLEVRQVRRNYLKGILGDGRGSIRVDTGSGSVRLIGG